MPPFDKFTGLILLAIACLLLVSGSAYLNSLSSESPIALLKYTVGGRSHLVTRRVRRLNTHPPTKFQTFGEGIDPPPSLRPTTPSLEEMAVSVVQSQLGIDRSNIHFQSGFSEGQSTFLYVRQSHKGVPFANAVANVALHNNRIVTFGSSFVRITQTNISPIASRKVQSVIPRAEKVLQGKFNGHATLEYLSIGPGNIHLTHVVQIQNDNKGTWFEAYMDAHSGAFIAVTDFVAEASYRVVPIEERGLRSGQTTLEDPQDTSSSPLGWHNNGANTTTSTDGNNVVAFTNKVNFWTRRKEAVTTPESRAGLVKNNLDAARTNAFYVINTMHDIAYKYGFTEKSFNFQTNNSRGAGSEMIVSKGVPSDASSRSSLQYDIAMENDIIIHEFTHGITKRMVGGGSARCFDTDESEGLGEGFSDAMAEYVCPIFNATGNTRPAGLRTYPYSISEVTNPLRYSTMNNIEERSRYGSHRIGEIWANMLHNVHAALVERYGFSGNARTDATTSEGNVIFMHLFIGALSRMPCNPTFLHARDAWIQADKDRNEGRNKCLLWKAFASRGLGVGAQERRRIYTEGTDVPPDCIHPIHYPIFYPIHHPIVYLALALT
ncbi:Fungalysin metallopeptidase-domain-containing protein [Infundibulicybe gibba]|nr:Fungalysin metallopeptidase-domain-containing protein [Infundibulicybe gibba]